MPKKFKPNFLLDEQMYFSDSKITLAYQIREELRELNKNFKAFIDLNKQDETPEQAKDTQTEGE